MGVVSRPFMFDPIAVGELLEAQASRTESGNLRPGSRSLLEQVDCLRTTHLPPSAIPSFWRDCTTTRMSTT
jgi:hypothetical protein